MKSFTQHHFLNHKHYSFSIRKNGAGFTLIELTIYTAIIGIISVLMLGFLWNIIFGNIKATSYQEVQENARFALAKMTQEVKKATGIRWPPIGVSADFLLLNMAALHLNPTVFYIEDGKLKITYCVGCPNQKGPYELMSNLVVINNLKFSNFSYPNTPGAVRVEMTIDHINLNTRPEYQASINLKSTIALVAGGAASPPPYLSQLHYRWRNDDGGE